MGDRFCMSIQIGGNPGTNRDALMDELAGFDADMDEDGVRTMCLHYEDRGDAFDDLKEKLRGWGLPYDHHTEAKYEFDGTVSYWRPGMKDERFVLALQDGSPVISFETLTHMASEGKTLQDVIATYSLPAMPKWVSEEVSV